MNEPNERDARHGTMRILLTMLALLTLCAGSSRADEPRVGRVDHVGLTVTDLAASEAFFTRELGFRVLRHDDAYPAAFLTNDQVIVTLWRASDPASAVPFDRKHNLAFAIDSFQALDALHERLAKTPGVRIEFAPEPLSGGPARHMMIREPSGNRLEFIHRPAEPAP